LCTKHFADVRLVAPTGEVRETLTAVHIAKMRALEQELARVTGWREAICRFSAAV